MISERVKALSSTSAVVPGETVSGANLLTTAEAADRLRLSPRTLERLRVSGEGPKFLKVGPGKRARVLYQQHDLEFWLQQYHYSSTSEYIAPVNND